MDFDTEQLQYERRLERTACVICGLIGGLLGVTAATLIWVFYLVSHLNP